MSKISKILSIPITPILASVYPVLFLAAANWDQIKYGDMERSLVISILIGISFLLICRLAVQTWQKAAILGSAMALIFFSYGHIYQLIETNNIRWLEHHKLTLGIALVFLVVTSLVLRRVNKVDSPVLFINILLIGFCGFSLIRLRPIINDYFAEAFYQPSKVMISTEKQKTLPDLYVLVLDGYPRDDVLQEVVQYVNSTFTNNLRELGFYTAKCSQSNYNWTKLSISSMLNMEFITEPPNSGDPSQFRRVNKKIVDSLKHNKIRSTLESYGYKTVAFETGYGFTEIVDSDYYYSLKSKKIILNKIESLLMNTTLLYARYDFETWVTGKVFKENAKKKELDKNLIYYTYDLNQLVMEKLKSSISDVPGPKMIFAHIMVTHYPYVFNPDGSRNEVDVYGTKSLRKTIPVINEYLLTLVKSIIADSKQPPIIIILGDHGYRASDQIILKNHLSVYASQKVLDRMYSTITPINLFRIIMTEEYGDSLPVVKDRSFITSIVGDPNFRESPGGCVVK